MSDLASILRQSKQVTTRARLLFHHLGTRASRITGAAGRELVSDNPGSAEAPARVTQATPEGTNQVLGVAEANFQIWREVPARKRGAVVRRLGTALRELGKPRTRGDLEALKLQAACCRCDPE